jgi:hypothetical protein
MKTFIFTNEYQKTNRTYGGSTYNVKIYLVKNNVPEYLGELTYNTASTRGAIGEVNDWLVKNKHLPKSWSVGRESYNESYNPYYHGSWSKEAATERGYKYWIKEV